MTSPNTPTKLPTGTPARPRNVGTRTSPRARGPQPPDQHPVSSWLVWVGVSAALAAAIWLVIAGVATQDETVPSARANQASTARLQGLADHYEAARRARADQAYSARLQGLADQYEAARRARADRAYSARLQELADQYQSPSSRVNTGWRLPVVTRPARSGVSW